MATKDEKRTLKQLEKKYAVGKGTKTLSILKATPMTTAFAGGAYAPILTAFAFVDIPVTGGIGTAAMTAVACIINYATGELELERKKHFTNAAGQSIQLKGPLKVKNIFEKMENQLQTAFNKAAAPEASLEEQKNFLAQQKDVEKDIEKLFPFFGITSGGRQYFFSLAEKFIGPNEKIHILHPEAVKQIQEKISKSKKIEQPKIQPKPKKGFGL